MGFDHHSQSHGYLRIGTDLKAACELPGHNNYDARGLGLKLNRIQLSAQEKDNER